MNWTKHVEDLKNGASVSFRPRGNSMTPKIESGQLVTLKPVEGVLSIGDIVLCKVQGRYYLHLVKAIRGDQYQIGNNKGHINGWTKKENVFGVCVKVGDE